jgi:hypothetical protein
LVPDPRVIPDQAQRHIYVADSKRMASARMDTALMV